jgi:hypothetical protein
MLIALPFPDHKQSESLLEKIDIFLSIFSILPFSGSSDYHGIFVKRIFSNNSD